MRRRAAVLASAGCLILALGIDARAGGFIRSVSNASPGGQGAYVNLIVREVRVTPIRAHVGDVVRIDLAIEAQGDSYHDTTSVEARANGKVVASKLFRFGFREPIGRTYRETLNWDTSGARPGEYRIRGEVFLFYDASEFDNFLDVKEPLVLLPAGEAFPAGMERGGTAVAVDPRWRPRRAGDGSPPAGTTGGY
jgi:hypothetical protein